MTERTEYRMTLYALSLITIIICRPLGSSQLFKWKTPPRESTEATIRVL